MKKIFNAVYHFHQYYLKPNKRQRNVIALAKKERTKLRLIQEKYHGAYLLGVLRNINPFVFEELLLLCFKERGFRVKRSLRHTGDGGIDGTVFNADGQKLILQAKRYKNAINPAHITHFIQAIQKESAAGGFFIHTGRTGIKSRANQTRIIKILSGEALVKFVLGQ